MAVPRGILLSWLAIAALACWARADEPAITPSPLEQATSLAPLAPGAPRVTGVPHAKGMPIEGMPDEPTPEVFRAPVIKDSQVRPAGFMARQPNPDEPLGFSSSRFQPNGGSVDPSLSSEVFEPSMPEEFEEYNDPTDIDAPAPAVSSGEWLRTGHFYLQQSVTYLSRSVNVKNSLVLARDFSSSLNPHDQDFLQIPLDMGYQPGTRTTLGRYLGRDTRNRDHSVEFTFLGLNHWGYARTMIAQVPGAIFSSVDPTLNIPIFNRSDVQGFSQTADFNSYEINYRIDQRLTRDRMVYTRDSQWVRQATPSLLPSLFAGIRVLNINEAMLYFANSAVGNATYKIQTHNDMVGLQVGTDWFYERSEWRLGGRMKAGSLVNWDSQSSVVTGVDPAGAPIGQNRNEFAKDHTLAFVGDLNFIGEYRFRPNFGFRASYDLMWVTNLALAQNQITFFPSTPPGIADSHDLFFQGVSIGFEWSR